MTQVLERRESEPVPLKIADIFPGQGFRPAEFVATAKNLSSSRRALEVFRLTDETLKDIFPGNHTFSGIVRSGTEREVEQLSETEFAQPAVLTLSMAAVAVLEEFNPEQAGKRPAAVSGHSAGMIGALWRSKVIETRDAIWLSGKRGEAMKAAKMGRQPGSMATVLGRGSIDEARLAEICGGKEVELVNLNSPTQIVISGLRENVEKVGPEISAAGLRVIPLNTSDAFHHSKLMRPAVETFDKALISARLKDPVVPVYLNSTGEPLTSWIEIISVLADEVAKPVNWSAVINRMKSDGINAFREFGHGGVLTDLLKRSNPESKIVSIESAEAARESRFK